MNAEDAEVSRRIPYDFRLPLRNPNTSEQLPRKSNNPTRRQSRTNQEQQTALATRSGAWELLGVLCAILRVLGVQSVFRNQNRALPSSEPSLFSSDHFFSSTKPRDCAEQDSAGQERWPPDGIGCAVDDPAGHASKREQRAADPCERQQDPAPANALTHQRSGDHDHQRAEDDDEQVE